MKQIYVIRSFGGQYDDAWVHVSHVTDDLEKGQAFVNMKNEQTHWIPDAISHAEAKRTAWQAENPAPDWHTTRDSVEYSKWYNDGHKVYEAALTLFPQEIQDGIDEEAAYWDINPVEWL